MTRARTRAPLGLPMSDPRGADEREAERFADRVGAGAVSLPDLSQVPVHADAAAARDAAALGARAFTADGEISFAAGQFRPDTSPGRRLIAHELAHVAQQAARPGQAVVHRAPEDENSGGAGGAGGASPNVTGAHGTSGSSRPAPAPDTRPLAQLSPEERIGAAIELCAHEMLLPAVAAEIGGLLEAAPDIALIGGTVKILQVLRLPVAAPVTIVLVGAQVVELGYHLGVFAARASAATDKDALRDAANHLAKALAMVTVNLALAVLLSAARRPKQPLTDPPAGSRNALTSTGEAIRVPADVVPAEVTPSRPFPIVLLPNGEVAANDVGLATVHELFHPESLRRAASDALARPRTPGASTGTGLRLLDMGGGQPPRPAGTSPGASRTTSPSVTPAKGEPGATRVVKIRQGVVRRLPATSAAGEGQVKAVEASRPERVEPSKATLVAVSTEQHQLAKASEDFFSAREYMAELEKELKAGSRTASGTTDTAQVKALRKEQADFRVVLRKRHEQLIEAERVAEIARIPILERMRLVFDRSTERRTVAASAKIDQVGRLRTPAQPLTVDHIVSLKRMTEMTGFERLTADERRDLATRMDNLILMDKSANSSKNEASWAYWPQASFYYEETTVAKMRAEDAKLTARIQEWIRETVRGR